MRRLETVDRSVVGEMRPSVSGRVGILTSTKGVAHIGLLLATTLPGARSEPVLAKSAHGHAAFLVHRQSVVDRHVLDVVSRRCQRSLHTRLVRRTFMQIRRVRIPFALKQIFIVHKKYESYYESIALQGDLHINI